MNNVRTLRINISSTLSSVLNEQYLLLVLLFLVFYCFCCCCYYYLSGLNCVYSSHSLSNEFIHTSLDLPEIIGPFGYI